MIKFQKVLTRVTEMFKRTLEQCLKTIEPNNKCYPTQTHKGNFRLRYIFLFNCQIHLNKLFIRICKTLSKIIKQKKFSVMLTNAANPYWTRALPKGPKRSFVVAVVVICGWRGNMIKKISEYKKNVQRNKKYFIGIENVPKYFRQTVLHKCHLWAKVLLSAHYGTELPCIYLYGFLCLVRSFVIFYGLV